jgi:hypothetical protein
MNITKLERAVVEWFLRDPQLPPLRGDVSLEKINVVARDFTGVGFLTRLEPTEETKLFEDGVTLRWGQVGARVNAPKVETGYVVYVDDGYLRTIEGYTYGDDWPETVDSFELYELKLGAELGANE